MMLNIGSEKLEPQADYEYIEEYDRELNTLQERRIALLESIKATGAYEQGIPELGDMMENADGEYTPIQGLAQRIAAAGGAENLFYHLPLAEKSAVLQELNNNISLVRAQVDDILGISDIVRGVTAASETATAQEIKGRWVGIRLTRKRETVIYTVKEMLRITAQLLASHITPENLQRMTQMQISEEMLSVMQQDTLMDFLIDIETDSTVAKDEFQEKQTFQEMLNGVAQYAQSVLPMVQQNMLPADASSALLRAALKPYMRYDKTLDEALTQLPTSQQQLTQLNQQLQQLQQEGQQTAQQLQYWQSEAQRLQQAATEAKAAKEQAEARLKDAQAQKTAAQIPTEVAEQAETMANTELKEAQTEKAYADAISTVTQGRTNGQQNNG
jgi:DNA repair exonuclease SbcCD ATPase subunit